MPMEKMIKIQTYGITAETILFIEKCLGGIMVHFKDQFSKEPCFVTIDGNVDDAFQAAIDDFNKIVDESRIAK